MKRSLSQTVRSMSPRLYSFLNTLRLLYARDSYLVKLGLFDSYKKGIPADASGQPIPWMSYSATQFHSIDFTSLSPTGCRNYQTSVYYRDNNCLAI